MAGPRIDNAFFLKRLLELSIEYRIIPVLLYVYPKISNVSFIRSICSLLLYPYRLVRLVIYGKMAQRNIDKLIDEFKPDIIHSNSGIIHDGLICAKKKNIPHVIHLREYQDLDFGYRIYPSKNRFIRLLHTTNVIAITKDIAQHFLLDDYKRCRVIYNGIYSCSNVHFCWPKKHYFLCCSQIRKVKGIEHVITAFAKFHSINKDYKLVILGTGDEIYINYLKKLAIDLNCAESVEWKGFCNNPIEYMKYATALVVASYNEGFGRMTAEAIFAGSITIGRNTGGTKEIIEETGGLLFDDNTKIADCMSKVQSFDRDEYYELIKRAQLFAQQNYSNEANLKKTYDFYREIIKEE